MKRASLFAFLLPAALILTGCGGGSPSNTIEVVFTDFQFNPDSFSVPAGQEITLNAKNDGAVVHEFVIMNFGTTVGEDFGDEDEGNIYWEIEVGAGGQTSTTFTAPSEPGEYQVVCGTKGHYIAGMVGKLIVVSQ
jgi:uncharacterized cupredoxin-like copper-binding protein